MSSNIHKKNSDRPTLIFFQHVTVNTHIFCLALEKFICFTSWKLSSVSMSAHAVCMYYSKTLYIFCMTLSSQAYSLGQIHKTLFSRLSIYCTKVLLRIILVRTLNSCLCDLANIRKNEVLANKRYMYFTVCGMIWFLPYASTLKIFFWFRFWRKMLSKVLLYYDSRHLYITDTM